MKQWLLMLLGACYVPLVLADEIDLAIPQSPKQMEQVLDDNAPCKGCGVVTDVRQVKDKQYAQEQADDPHLVEVTRSSADGDVQVSYLTDPESAEVYDPVTDWLVTVRYDDGAYDDIYQRTRPSVQQGDRVQVVAGRVVPKE